MTTTTTTKTSTTREEKRRDDEEETRRLLLALNAKRQGRRHKNTNQIYDEEKKEKEKMYLLKLYKNVGTVEDIRGSRGASLRVPSDRGAIQTSQRRNREGKKASVEERGEETISEDGTGAERRPDDSRHFLELATA